MAYMVLDDSPLGLRQQQIECTACTMLFTTPLLEAVGLQRYL